MSDLGQLPAGFLGTLRSCLPLCFGRHQEDPERQPLFPPPSHILTPPRPHPNLPRLSSNPSFTVGHHRWASEPVSPVLQYGIERTRSGQRLSDEERDRMDTISRAYAERMHSLNPNLSLPPTPLTSHHAPQPLTTDPPITDTIRTPTPLGSGTYDTTRPVPLRPSVPNLGRSTSEPRGISDMGFSKHQIPSGPLTVHRGGRSRSATTLERRSDAVDRWGRSPGPGLGPDPVAASRKADRDGEERSPFSGRSVSQPQVILHGQREREEQVEEVHARVGFEGSV
ncbi:hypothetical protein IAR55_002534 [Kwoniella newhampshirensis]|uniref:Uncharacterized protein n=1 Tax=Kwoniella newhampshirensis TaxID=1651941 RepID=A0AAW0Z1R1_9TREE